MMETATILRDIRLPPSRTLLEKLNTLQVPQEVEFRRVSFAEAASYLRRLGWALDLEESDEQARGVPVWVGVAGGAPLVLGDPGESKEVDRWFGRQSFTAALPIGICLGSAWATLAAAFGLEMHLHEEASKLVLWLPTAFPEGRLDDDSLLLLKMEIGLAKDLLQQRGLILPRSWFFRTLCGSGDGRG